MFLCYSACCLCHICCSCSSSSHTWDAFQLAHSSFRLYCVRNNLVVPGNSGKVDGKLGPCLLGDPPKINVPPPEITREDDEEKYPEELPAIKIYDDDVNMRFLVCGSVSTLVSTIQQLYPSFLFQVFFMSHGFHMHHFPSGCFFIATTGRWT